MPRQLITWTVLDYLGLLLHSHKQMEMHGIVHEGYLPCIRVLRPAEERSLKLIGWPRKTIREYSFV